MTSAGDGGSSRELDQILTAQATAMVERAKALGLTWTLRPASAGTGTGDNPIVTYDGDTERVGAVSLIGDIIPGDRVMMLQVPPAGNFVLGRIGGIAGSKTSVRQTATFRTSVAATGDTTLTTASQNIIPAVALTLASDADYLFTLNVDWDAFIAGGNNLCAATIQIDGVGLADQMIFQQNTSGVREVVSRTWYGTLLAGSHTLQPIAAKSLNTGGWATRAAGTSLVYQIWQ